MSTRDRLTLRTRREFDLVFSEGKAVSDALFVLHFLSSGEPGVRLGLVVSRRTGCAVARNRLRRVVREVIRLNRENITGGVHLIVVARGRARWLARDRRAFRLAEGSLLGLLGRAGLLDRE